MKKINVLNVTNIIPVSTLPNKKNENNILLEYGDRLNKVKMNFLYMLPYANFCMSFISRKWSLYYSHNGQTHMLENGAKVDFLRVFYHPIIKCFNWVTLKISFLLNKKAIHRLLQSGSYDLLHSQNVTADAFITREIYKSFSIPYVLTVRGLPDVYNRLIYSNLLSAKTIICLNAITQTKIMRLYNINSVVIPHGVDDIFFQPQNKQKINNEKVIKLVTVCRLLTLKNIDKVINAIARSKKEIYFDIYGDGSEFPKLKGLVAELKLGEYVSFKGRVDNNVLPNLLSNYDCFIMPSFPESLGRVYFEAMAVGLPVIGVKGTGVDGAITDRKEGFLLDSVTVGELKSCFNHEDFNSTKLASMGKSARVLAEDYRWENIIKKLEYVYIQACKR